MKTLKLALGAKLVWKMYKNLWVSWVRILRHKYLNCVDPLSIFKHQNTLRISMIQKFMLDCRSVILDVITQDIGEGREALFWEDSREAYLPIRHLLENDQLIDGIINQRGMQLCDYIEYINGDLSWDGSGNPGTLRALQIILGQTRSHSLQQKDFPQRRTKYNFVGKEQEW